MRSVDRESGAPLPGERIETLRGPIGEALHWVSLEPVLDINRTLDVIVATNKRVNLYKCGRANDLGAITKQTDWQGYTKELIRVLRRLRARHYIREDLQPICHAVQPARVQQHH